MSTKEKIISIFYYYSLLGFVIDFFAYLQPIIYSSSWSGSSIVNSEKTLMIACIDGTIPGGGFCFAMSIIALLIGLGIDIYITIKIIKNDPLDKWVNIFYIIFGGIVLIISFIELGIFHDFFNGQWIKTNTDYHNATVSDGATLWYLYLSNFSAGAAAIAAGILGLTIKYSYSGKTYDYTSYMQKFSEGEEVIVTCDIVSANVKSGDRLEITKKIPYYGIVYCRSKKGGEEFKVYPGVLKKVEKNTIIETTMPKKADEQVSENNTTISENNTSASENKANVAENKEDKFEEIKKFKDLLDLGVITQEEFDKKKKEILNL